MKLLYVIDTLGAGGAERSTGALWYHLRDRGITLKIAVLEHRAVGIEKEILAAGFDVTFFSSKNFLSQALAIRKLILEFNPSLVHSVLFRSNLRVRVVRLFHSFVHLESLVNETYSEFRLADPNVTRLKLEGYRWLDRLTQKFGVDHFHANGKSVADHYQQKLNISQDKMTIVLRGRKANSFIDDGSNRQRIRDSINNRNRILLVTVGRHEYQKGQDTLLDAMAMLGADLNRLQLLIVGRGGHYTQELNARIKKHELEDHVLLTGHREDVQAILAAADIFVFPSRFEGLPGALIEAEAAGIPILCSDIPNNHEVAQANVNAFFFKVNDSHSLAQLLERLMKDELLRKKMGAEGIKIFNERFLLEEAHERMEKLIRGLSKKQ